jgi:hypothetical protein
VYRTQGVLETEKMSAPLLKLTLRACSRIPSLLFAAALLRSSPLRAQEIATLDPVQTEIHYTLGPTMHTVHGTFKLKSGIIHFDPTSGKADGAIVVDATNSDNEGRDSKMHREILDKPEIY